MFFEAVSEGPASLSYVCEWAIMAGDMVDNSYSALWWYRIFYPGEDVPECPMRAKTSTNIQRSEDSSDGFRDSVDVRKDNCGFWRLSVLEVRNDWGGGFRNMVLG